MGGGPTAFIERRSRWARVWPPPDSTGFQWKSPGSSDGMDSWTRHHASRQNDAYVVSGKVARPIRTTGSRKLPVVWQGPYYQLLSFMGIMFIFIFNECVMRQ